MIRTHSFVAHTAYLKRALQKHALLHEYSFYHLSEIMPHRVEAIIEPEGWYTPY